MVQWFRLLKYQQAHSYVQNGSIISPHLLRRSIMPIEINDCDDGLGNIIVSRGPVTDQELIDPLKRHLPHDIEKFKKFNRITNFSRKF